MTDHPDSAGPDSAGPDSTGSFTALTVVEIAGSPAGAYCGKLFADYGAHTMLVEPPDGSALRADPGRFSFLHTSKVSVTSDDPQGLIAEVQPDIVIESSAPGPLGPRAGDFDPNGPIRVEVSPFGRTGPYATWSSTDITDAAISGHAFLNGSPDREPLQGPPGQPAYASAVFAFIGAMAAHRLRAATGLSQTVEVAHHEVMAALHQFTLLRYTHNGDVLTRMGNRYAGPGRPIGLYEGLDGALSLVVPRDDQLERLLAGTGLWHLLDEPGIASTYDLMHHPTLLDEHLRPWLARQPIRETVEMLQELRVPASPVNTPLDLLQDPQLAARSFWHSVEAQPDGTAVHVPGPPFRMSGHRWRVANAPALDRDRRPVPEHTPARSATRAHDAAQSAPLAGIRVLDLTRVWAGPLATRILADLGADVIRIEAPFGRGPAHVDDSSVMSTRYYPDNDPGPRHWNRIGFENKYATNKRGITLDLKDETAKAAFERLVAQSDVLVENFSPRVMRQFGLDDERLRALNPSLINMAMPGYGRTGPHADRVAYGPMIDSHAGFSTLMGYEDSPAWKGGVAWPDPVAGIHAAAAVLVALADRDADPEHRGQTIELAQLETAINFVGDAIVAAQLNGQDPTPPGNRHPIFSPQGIYRCAGDDRWLAISVTSDQAWRTLAGMAQFPADLTELDTIQRRERADDIDELITAWTSSRDATELMARLQILGVTAAVVADAPMVQHDPHLADRSFFADVSHSEAGTHPWPRLPVVLSGARAPIHRAAPLLGEHNEEILTTLGGMDQPTLADLTARGVTPHHPGD